MILDRILADRKGTVGIISSPVKACGHILDSQTQKASAVVVENSMRLHSLHEDIAPIAAKGCIDPDLKLGGSNWPNTTSAERAAAVHEFFDLKSRLRIGEVLQLQAVSVIDALSPWEDDVSPIQCDGRISQLGKKHCELLFSTARHKPCRKNFQSKAEAFQNLSDNLKDITPAYLTVLDQIKSYQKNIMTFSEPQRKIAEGMYLEALSIKAAIEKQYPIVLDSLFQDRMRATLIAGSDAKLLDDMNQLLEKQLRQTRKQLVSRLNVDFPRMNACFTRSIDHKCKDFDGFVAAQPRVDLEAAPEVNAHREFLACKVGQRGKIELVESVATEAALVVGFAATGFALGRAVSKASRLSRVLTRLGSETDDIQKLIKRYKNFNSGVQALSLVRSVHAIQDRCSAADQVSGAGDPAALEVKCPNLQSSWLNVESNSCFLDAMAELSLGVLPALTHLGGRHWKRLANGEIKADLERKVLRMLEEKYVPIPKPPAINAGMVKAADNMAIEDLNRIGVKYQKTSEDSYLASAREVAIPDGVKPNKLIEIIDLPPVGRDSPFELALKHPKMAEYLKKMRERGYRLVVDPDAPLLKYGAYQWSHNKTLAIMPNSSWTTFQHEFQHFEFSEMLGGRSWKDISEAVIKEGKSLAEILPSSSIKSKKELSDLEKLIRKGYGELAANERLSFQREMETRGFSIHTGPNMDNLSAYRYSERHRISELLQKAKGSTPLSSAERWALAQHMVQHAAGPGLPPTSMPEMVAILATLPMRPLASAVLASGYLGGMKLIEHLELTRKFPTEVTNPDQSNMFFFKKNVMVYYDAIAKTFRSITLPPVTKPQGASP